MLHMYPLIDGVGLAWVTLKGRHTIALPVTVVRPKGHHCQGGTDSLAQMPARSTWCQGLPIQRMADAMMALHQTVDCIDVAQ
jgi:hypothetical protein